MAGKSSLQRGVEEAPKNGKESSHSAHANGYKSLVPKVTSPTMKILQHICCGEYEDCVYIFLLYATQMFLSFC